MKKIEYEYLEKYGSVPKDNARRFLDFIKTLNLSDEDSKYLKEKTEKNLHMKWKQVRFVIYLVPKATPRPRINRFSNCFYVVGAKENRDLFMKYINDLDVPMITTPCKFKCISYLPIPSSMYGVEKILAELGLIYPIGKPDWDNLGKTYSDMIQGSLIFDDYLIIEGLSRKFYSTKPRIEITIDYMEEFDSIYNEKKLLKKLEKGKK